MAKEVPDQKLLDEIMRRIMFDSVRQSVNMDDPKERERFLNSVIENFCKGKDVEVTESYREAIAKELQKEEKTDTETLTEDEDGPGIELKRLKDKGERSGRNHESVKSRMRKLGVSEAGVRKVVGGMGGRETYHSKRAGR